jgi:hypothetical protein
MFVKWMMWQTMNGCCKRGDLQSNQTIGALFCFLFLFCFYHRDLQLHKTATIDSTTESKDSINPKVLKINLAASNLFIYFFIYILLRTVICFEWASTPISFAKYSPTFFRFPCEAMSLPL